MARVDDFRNFKTEGIVTLIQECGKMGIKVRTPDINSSLPVFSANKEGEILYGLPA